ncbi:adenylyl-sulfate kinase [uncultured Aquimarina sp.]|uniref:adenylyl-sulfate kinase n=1 Tax=uncultured Aquimarina sp. TaxID=575652 RepID=UPI00262CDC4A|nr:adenylyl-sulfate kinase [uncultured Aquimarina sp.]
MKPVFILLTGLSGSGKTTLAKGLMNYYSNLENKVCHLDGDDLRKALHCNLGFSKEDRHKQLMLTAELSLSYLEKGISVIVSLIAPYNDHRVAAQKFIENKGFEFELVYVDCPIKICIKRDPKGLYKKVLKGEIKNFTGIDDPYEPPKHADLHLQTEKVNYQDSLQKMIEHNFIKTKQEKL